MPTLTILYSIIVIAVLIFISFVLIFLYKKLKK